MIQLCHFQWSSLKLAEVNLKHGSEIPIEAPRSLRGKQCLVVGGWWLVVGYMVLTWSKMRSPHSDDSNHSNPIWPGGLVGIISQQKPTSDKPNINQSGLGFLRSGPMKSFAHWKWRVSATEWLPLGLVFGCLARSKICEFCRCIPRPREGCVTASITCQGTQPLMWRQHRWFPALSLIAASFQSAARTKGIWMRERGSRTRGHFITIWQ